MYTAVKTVNIDFIEIESHFSLRVQTGVSFHVLIPMHPLINSLQLAVATKFKMSVVL